MKRLFLLCLVLSFLFLCPTEALASSSAKEVTEISTRAELEGLAGQTGSFRLVSDVDLSDSPWTPIPFFGTLDGNGHTIYNMTVSEADPEMVTTHDGNRKGYQTLTAGLFSKLARASVSNLTLLGGLVHLETESCCYGALLAGSIEKSEIRNCTVSGRVYLNTGAPVCGVGGISGYGSGIITDCSADVELVVIDLNPDQKCEQFLGGITANGYPDIESCTVDIRGYASVRGYVHCGGLVGMHYIPNKKLEHRGYVRYNTIQGFIRFFEDNDIRRAYCKAAVGEKSNDQVVIAKNEEAGFARDEVFVYTSPLLPETCAVPDLEERTVSPSKGSFGYTLHICRVCGASYRDAYTPPLP